MAIWDLIAVNKEQADQNNYKKQLFDTVSNSTETADMSAIKKYFDRVYQNYGAQFDTFTADQVLDKDVYISQITTKTQKLRDYRQMALFPEIASAIDTMCYSAVVNDENNNVVTLNIKDNNPNFVWDIFDDYIDTQNNISEEYPNGFNPIGIKRFNLNIDVDTNKLKDMNEWDKISEYVYENNNTALIKYVGNNLIVPQEVESRNLVLDEYQGDGKTVYDSNEKIYINNHKYSILEENEEYDESNEGFKSVMQTTVVPIMDKIIIPEITSNSTYRYSIGDFNNIYSLTPGSDNPYRNQ